MDFKKIISAAMIPTVILVVLGIIGSVLGVLLGMFLPGIGGIIALVLGLGVFVLECLILGWGGYSAVKKYQFDLVGAALTGAVAGFVSGLINSIVSVILSLFATVPAASSNPTQALYGGAAALLCGPVMVIASAVFGAVIGAVLGAIGGFLGRGKKK